MSLKRWLLLAFISMAVVSAVIYGFMPRPAPVNIAKVLTGPMRVTIREEGKTRLKERFVVSAPVSGYMRRATLKAGDPVKKGHALALIEPLRPDALDPRSKKEAVAEVSAKKEALSSAKERVAAQKADAEYAAEQFKRIKSLYELGFVSKDELERAAAEAKRTEAGLLSAKAEAEVFGSELQRALAALGEPAEYEEADFRRIVTVRSPVDGTVLRIHQESEGVVAAGEPLLEVGDPKRLEVMVEALSSDAANIRAGTPVVFGRWGGEAPLSGFVKTVEPSAFTKVSSLGVEEQRVLVVAEITSSEEERPSLGDGYRVEASFVIWEKDNVLQVPSSALFRMGEGWAVFIVREKRARIGRVEIGMQNGLQAEVISGISEKDEVVLNPDDSIEDGLRIRPR